MLEMKKKSVRLNLYEKNNMYQNMYTCTKTLY